MKSIRLNTLMLVALGLLTQGLSGMSPTEKARQVWGPSASGAFARARSIPGYVGSSISPIDVVSTPAVSEAAQPRKWFNVGAWNRPSLESVRAWPGRARESLGQYIPSGETVRAVPGQIAGGLTTGFSYYPGSAVMRGASGVKSGASWLAGKAASYVPASVSDRFGKYISQPISEYAVQPVGKYLSENVGTPLSQTSVAQMFAGMTEEQKQAAVGLAAIIGAGIAAKQGYNWWRGPSTFDMLNQLIQQKISNPIAQLIHNPASGMGNEIGRQIGVMEVLINQEADAKALNEAQKIALQGQLVKFAEQLQAIVHINKEIKDLEQRALSGKLEQLHIQELYDFEIKDLKALTVEQKELYAIKLANLNLSVALNEITKMINSGLNKCAIRNKIAALRDQVNLNVQFGITSREQQKSLLEILAGLEFELQELSK